MTGPSNDDSTSPMTTPGSDGGGDRGALATSPPSGILAALETGGADALCRRARDDWQAVQAWLDDRARSPQTRRAYLAEARRLVLWGLLERGRTLTELTREDLEHYEAFLADPRPRERWCGPPVRLRLPDGRPNPAWRPLGGGLGPRGLERARAAIKSLYDYLVETGRIERSPLAGRRPPRAAMGERDVAPLPPSERALTAADVEAVLAAVERWPEGRRHRGRWLLRLLAWTGLRIGEVATHTMGDFRPAEDGSWRLVVVGKGGRVGDVVVPTALLEALAEYRQAEGLAPLPEIGEQTPLVIGPGGRALSARQLSRIVKQAFADAAAASDDPAVAARLRAATAHWLRHGMATIGATHARDLAGIAALQRQMRHAALATTMRYVHVTDPARQALAEQIARKPRTKG